MSPVIIALTVLNAVFVVVSGAQAVHSFHKGDKFLGWFCLGASAVNFAAVVVRLIS